MTVPKALALTAAFVGVFGLGVLVGPSVMDRFSDRQPSAEAGPAQTMTVPASSEEQAPARQTPRARSTANRNAATPARVRPSAEAPSALSASEPRLHDRLKPVLNRGARMTVAAEGFRSAEQFAAVAHAARNTNVPFMVLKHRVVTEGQTLEAALRDVKPDVDAKAEVAKAEAAAKSDVAAIAG
jgi:hypothetical protein